MLVFDAWGDIHHKNNAGVSPCGLYTIPVSSTREEEEEEEEEEGGEEEEREEGKEEEGRRQEEESNNHTAHSNTQREWESEGEKDREKEEDRERGEGKREQVTCPHYSVVSLISPIVGLELRMCVRVCVLL